MNFNKKIKKVLFSDYDEIEKYFPITKSHLINALRSKVFGRSNVSIFNFIITSKAEIRIFRPLLNYILEQNIKVRVNLFFLVEGLSFDKKLNNKIKDSTNVAIENSVFYLTNKLNSVNVICLDHGYYNKPHKVGIDIISFLNKKNAKTVCLQHGGNQEDYIKGQLTSKSKYQIVYGKLIYDRFISSSYNENYVYLTGNPLHDKLINSKQNLEFDKSRKVIALITCMHTEYDNEPDPKSCYIEYLKKVYQNINFGKSILIIKMHPYDSIDDNLYEEIRQELNIDNKDIKIIHSDDYKYSVYDIISASDLVISRASTVIEEALMLKKNVIAYDLFENGSSVFYDFLNKYNSYTRVVGRDANFKSIISDYVEKPAFSPKDINELIKNTTYKLDGKSSKRIIDILKKISKD